MAGNQTGAQSESRQSDFRSPQEEIFESCWAHNSICSLLARRWRDFKQPSDTCASRLVSFVFDDASKNRLVETPQLLNCQTGLFPNSRRRIVEQAYLFFDRLLHF